MTLLNGQNALLNTLWNESVEGFPDNLRDENLDSESSDFNINPTIRTTVVTTTISSTTSSTVLPTTLETIMTTTTQGIVLEKRTICH